MLSLRAIALVLGALGPVTSAVPSLSVKVTGPQTVTNVENFKVVTTITNTGDTTLKLLKDPKSPLSPLPADTFEIADSEGASPTFIGIVAKYVRVLAIAVGGEALSVLVPGQSTKVEHNLSEAYGFAKEGTYVVVPNNLFYVVNSAKEAEPLYATVDTFTTKLMGNLAYPRHIQHPHPSYVNCSASQQSSLVEAAETAKSYAWKAYKYLEANTAASQRYTTWFGAFERSRYNTAKNNFRLISSPPSFPSFKYDCSCTTVGPWGYVKPDEFGIVYLCPTFWTLPLEGKESMAGSLVQKSSHFTRNGGALDYVYTQPLCKDLAIKNATQAIHNADSYEYFAENDPAL